MIFSNKIGDKKLSQIKAIVNEVVTEAFHLQSQEFAQQRDAQTTFLNEMAEKNQKSIRRLSDTVEDFLDTLQEEDEEQRQSQHNLQVVKNQEQNLLKLLSLYQQQIELFENKATAIPLALDGGLRQPKVAVCAILSLWGHGNQKNRHKYLLQYHIIFVCKYRKNY